MNFRKYLLDRAGYILLYFFGILLSILVLYLSIVLDRERGLQDGVLYTILLCMVFLCVFFGVDYIRKKTFYKSLNRLVQEESDLEDIHGVAEAYSCEHQLYKEILQRNYKSYKENLSKLEEAQQQHMYFINQWVHQMKTPVSVIHLLLQEGKEDPAALMDSLHEENEKLTRGLDMALYTARLSQFHIDFKVDKVDLIPIVRDVINANKKSCIKYSIYPKIIGDKELVVETDTKWIGFVITQIIVNAIKYSRYKEGMNKSIVIDTRREGDKSFLSITDEGMGIPKKDLGRVFDAFFTGENGRKYSEATGMGLYLAKRICGELGHEIFIDSEEGEWTQVTVAFHEGKSIFTMK